MANALKLSIRFEDEKFRFKHEEENDTVNFDSDGTDDQHTLDLWDEILSEIFCDQSNDESLQFISDSWIYNLDSEKDIQRIEANDRFILNEGSPEVEDFDLLMELAEEYFVNPIIHPVQEYDEVFVTAKGFIQIYSGEKVNAHGQSVVLWKSTDLSISLTLSDFYKPEFIIKQVEALGFKWSPLIRLCVYGHLKQIVGEKIYLLGEAKSLIPLSDEFQNILMAIPSYDDSDEDSDSLYDFVESEIQNNILYGSFPDYGRSLTGHWELSNIRLQELEDEALENRVLLSIQRRERSYVQSKNSFREKYQKSYKLVNDLNNCLIDVGQLFVQEPEVLKEIISLVERKVLRIENRLIYIQLKALVLKETLHNIKTNQSQILTLLNRINSGEFFEFHLLGLEQLEELFAVLWSKSGFCIHSDKKDIYFLLKNNLLRLRSKKLQASKH